MTDLSHINAIDTLDETIDEFMFEGGSIDEWHELPTEKQDALVAAAVQNRMDEGYWFKWSDGSVRDWPEGE